MKKKTYNAAAIVRREFRIPAAGLHIREAAGGEGESRIIEGYAVTFNVESEPLWIDDECEAREIIAPESITSELLDEQDIQMTMYHDGRMLLARSNNGAGTLSYEVDEKGVKFSFEAPRTQHGDEALELVRRGDIDGCSFSFSTRYYNSDFVECKSRVADGRTYITYIVRVITGVHDFTLTPRPAYPSTSVEAREFARNLREGTTEEQECGKEDAVRLIREAAKQVAAMRAEASRPIA